MTWVAWRQQRTETLTAVAILGLLAALLIPTGLQMASAYHHDGLSACLAQHPSQSCSSAISSFEERFNSIGDLSGWFTLIPGLVGVLLAAPFLLDLENGTYRLAWTQSITRRRWIVTKLGLTLAAALGIAAAMTLLCTWWRGPLAHLSGRMQPAAFDTQGTVVIGYTLFALGVALAVGVIWRRTVPALVVSFASYVAVRIFVDTWLRRRFESPLSVIWREGGGKLGGPRVASQQPAGFNHAWVLNEFPSDKLGHHVELVPGPCLHAAGGLSKCLAPQGLVYTRALFQPAGRFWAFQGIETALFGGIGVAAVLFAAWWTHRRTS